MRNRLLVVIGTLLFILGQIGVNFLIYKYKNKNTEIPKVQLRDVEENKKEKVFKNTFAVMLEQTDGTYTQSDSSEWPGVGYLYNTELSGCIDSQGNVVENAISFNDSTKTATVRTNGTIYCYLYFKGVSPTNGSISIKNNATYTTSTSVTLTLNATDASEMCISNSTSCTSWENYSTSKNWTLPTNDGTKTVYVTYRNASGKTVGPVSDTIILDTVAPSLTVSAPTGTSSSSPTKATSGSYTVKGTVSDVTSKVKSVTVNGSAATISGSNWSKAITLTNGTTTTVKVVATDKAGKTKTITRYVKFEGTNAGSLITEKGLWSSGLSGDGHRYTGTNPNNYICFGTTDKATCTGNTDAYMYRIIGVFESGGTKYMKLIKKEALNTAYRWHSSDTTDTDWGSSSLFKALNGNKYLKNTTYIPSGWEERIVNWTWRATNTLTYKSSGPHYYFTSPKGIYLNEILKKEDSSVTCGNKSDSDGTSARCAVGELTQPTGKIGLMYASDYALSLGSTALNLTTSTGINKTKLKTGWMYLWNSNNDSAAPEKNFEWTISRYGMDTSSYNIGWYAHSNGDVSTERVSNGYSVRPVFYLNYDAVIKSGTGTISNPYILGE